LNSIVEIMVSGIGKENREQEIKENETLHWYWLKWITNLQYDGMFMKPKGLTLIYSFIYTNHNHN